jgi:hypothetical protein
MLIIALAVILGGVMSSLAFEPKPAVSTASLASLEGKALATKPVDDFRLAA